MTRHPSNRQERLAINAKKRKTSVRKKDTDDDLDIELDFVDRAVPVSNQAPISL